MIDSSTIEKKWGHYFEKKNVPYFGLLVIYREA